MTIDKTILQEFTDAFLMNACNDYKIAVRARQDGKETCCRMWDVSPKRGMIEVEQFFFEWFDDDVNQVRQLLYELRKQALGERRGKKV